MRMRGLFEVEREDGDVMPGSSSLPLFTRVRGIGILRRTSPFGHSTKFAVEEGARVRTPPQRRFQAIICDSPQKCADVNQLPFALQWLNEVTLSVKDETEVPTQ